MRADVVPEVGVVLDQAARRPWTRRGARSPASRESAVAGRRGERRGRSAHGWTSRPEAVSTPERRVRAKARAAPARARAARWRRGSPRRGGDADMHMEAEEKLLARDEAERARPDRGSGRRRPPAGPPSSRTDGCGRNRSSGPAATAVAGTGRAARAAGPPACRGVAARGGGDLEHRLHELGLDLARWRGLAEDRLDRVASSNATPSTIISSSSMPTV